MSITRINGLVILLFLSARLVVSEPARADVTITDEDILVVTDWRWGDTAAHREYTANILISGEIKRGDYAAFVQAADTLLAHMHNAHLEDPIIGGNIFVNCNSRGGDVLEAMKIGRLIRERRMYTTFMGPPMCASACTLILIAGVERDTFPDPFAPDGSGAIGLHRPTFDPVYFANLAPEVALKKYNAKLDDLHKYFIGMGGSAEAFRLMMATPPDKIYLITDYHEAERLGFQGSDPAYDELLNSRQALRTGPIRWRTFKQTCLDDGDPNHIDDCLVRVLKDHPKYE